VLAVWQTGVVTVPVAVAQAHAPAVSSAARPVAGRFCYRCRRESHVGQLPFLHEALAFGMNCQPEILRQRGLVELEAP
jgi:hypothetical protein